MGIQIARRWNDCCHSGTNIIATNYGFMANLYARYICYRIQWSGIEDADDQSHIASSGTIII